MKTVVADGWTLEYSNTPGTGHNIMVEYEEEAGLLVLQSLEPLLFNFLNDLLQERNE